MSQDIGSLNRKAAKAGLGIAVTAGMPPKKETPKK